MVRPECKGFGLSAVGCQPWDGAERSVLARFAGLCGDLSLSAYLAALPLGECTPDTELLARNDRKLKTIFLHGALATYPLCGASRCPPLRKEEIRIGTAAVGKILPCHVNAFGLKGFDQIPEHTVSYNRVITSLSFK